jgi:hypothetical protein
LKELKKQEANQDDDRFWQRLMLPEEDRRRLYPGIDWTGSYRWFRSANVVDLWRYRNSIEKARICAVLLRKKPWRTGKPDYAENPDGFGSEWQ